MQIQFPYPNPLPYLRKSTRPAHPAIRLFLATPHGYAFTSYLTTNVNPPPCTAFPNIPATPPPQVRLLEDLNPVDIEGEAGRAIAELKDEDWELDAMQRRQEEADEEAASASDEDKLVSQVLGLGFGGCKYHPDPNHTKPAERRQRGVWGGRAR